MSGRSYLLTDTFTVRGNTATVTDVIQDAVQQLDVNGAADATIIIECFDVTAPSPGAVVLKIESSPFLDESTFALAAPPVTLTPSTTPVILKTVSAVSVAGLARVLRWHISVTGSGAWSATFRIRVVTNRSPYFVPTMLGNCLVWYRADLGITTTTGTSTVLMGGSERHPRLEQEPHGGQLAHAEGE